MEIQLEERRGSHRTLHRMLASLFIAPFTTLLPVFARDLLGVGANGQGLLLTAMGVGALCSAILIASAGDRLPRGMLMLGSTTLYGRHSLIFCVVPLVPSLAGDDGHRRPLPRALQCPGANRHSVPLSFRIPWPHDGNIHHEPGACHRGKHAHRRMSSLVGARWAAASMGAVGTLTMVLMYMVAPRARLIR